MCAAFSRVYLGGGTQSQGGDPAGSPRKQLWVLAPIEPSGQSSVLIWELISIPRLPGGTGTLEICPRVLANVFIFRFPGDVWFTQRLLGIYDGESGGRQSLIPSNASD